MVISPVRDGAEDVGTKAALELLAHRLMAIDVGRVHKRFRDRWPSAGRVAGDSVRDRSGGHRCFFVLFFVVGRGNESGTGAVGASVDGDQPGEEVTKGFVTVGHLRAELQVRA